MKKEHFTIKKGSKKEEAILHFPENSSINNVNELKLKLDELFKEHQHIIITGESVNSIDLSVLQVLYSAKCNASSLNKTIKFNLKMNDNLVSLIKLSGFSSLLN